MWVHPAVHGASVDPARRSRHRRRLFVLLTAAVAAVLAAVASHGAPAAGASEGAVPPGLRAFTVAGTQRIGAQTPYDGAVATSVRLSEATRIAAAPDGGFAMLDQRLGVLRVDAAGRVRILARHRSEMSDVAVGPDGSVFYIDDRWCVIRRIDPAGRVTRFAGRRLDFFGDACGSDGDGGSALDARFIPRRIAMSPQGLLVLDSTTLRRIGGDGVVTRLAGNGRNGRAVDGAIATATPLDLGIDSDLSSAPGGTPVFTDATGIWTITPDGSLRLLRRQDEFTSVSAASVLPDGGLLTVGLDGVSVIRGGMVSDLAFTSSGQGLWSASDDDAAPLSRAWTQAVDLAFDRDGGWLLADADKVLYVPAPGGRRLAVGIARPTISSRLPITATVEATQAARITLSVTVRGRRTGTRTVQRPAGRWVLGVAGGRRGALNVVSVTATTTVPPTQVATDRVAVLPGRTLPMAVPLRITGLEQAFMESIGGAAEPQSTCRRLGLRRVDCSDFDFDLCQEITAYRLRSDGILTGRHYASGERRCRFERRPHWDSRTYGVELPIP